MKIKIKETKQMEEIEIRDPKAGTDWTVDLLGNHGFHTDEDGICTMSQDDFEWWANLIERCQAAEDRLHELKTEYDSNEDHDSINEALLAMESGDIEYRPDYLNQVVDTWLANRKKEIIS